jgi:hypothetical protein
VVLPSLAFAACNLPAGCNLLAAFACCRSLGAHVEQQHNSWHMLLCSVTRVGAP